MESGATQWTRLPDMPVVCSHAEGATIVDGDRVLLLGGQIASLRLTDVVQAFDTREERWQIVGRLPYRLKTAVATLYEGFVYVSCGQRDAGPKDSRPSAIMAATWRAPLDF
jgi:N-acetylneuraminic acid mutarotase